MHFDELFSDSQEYPPATGVGGEQGLALPGGGGVYLLTDADDRFIQLAAAADLKRTLGSRLSGPQPAEGGATVVARKRADLRAIVRRIRWRRAYSMFEIAWQYYRLARMLLPETYLKQVGFSPCWFVHVDPEAEFPRFQAGKLLRSPPGSDLGPFATQADAARFIEILEDAFDLCRYFQVLQQAPRGQPCAYLDMGKCPAPCDGRLPMASYREMMTAALAFARGERQPLYQRWEAAMRAAAAERAYERAGAIRQSLERARRIEHETYRYVGPIEEARYLVVQRGPGTTQVKPFFVWGGAIEAGEPVRLKMLDAAVVEWVDRLQSGAIRDAVLRDVERAVRSEQMWLLSHFLFKREPPGLYLKGGCSGPPGELAERVRWHFAAKPREELQDLGGDGPTQT